MKKFYFLIVALLVFTFVTMSCKLFTDSNGDETTTSPTTTTAPSCVTVTPGMLTNTTGPVASGRTTGGDKSGIVINYLSDGWMGTNAGWDESECLISPDHTLDYEVGSLYRTHQGLAQFVVPPCKNANWGEMTNNQYISNDNSLRYSTDGTQAELSELWLTWDSEWVYCAVKGEMANSYDTGTGALQGNNIMVLFDLEPDYGISDFFLESTLPKAVYTRGFDVDSYLVVYCDYMNAPYIGLGGVEFRIWNNNHDAGLARINIPNSEYYNTNLLIIHYNGTNESNPDQRVLLFKIHISALTNHLSATESLDLKVIALTVDGTSGTGAYTYDLMPNNATGMIEGNDNLADNYFMIPFTDENGNVRTDIQPRYDAKINFLPGSVTTTNFYTD